MKKSAILAVVAAIFAALFSPRPAFASPNAVGNWSGTLDVGATKLRLVFKITNGAGGGLLAKMDSIDQGGRDLEVDVATLKGDKLKLELTQIQAVYEGTIDKTGTNITGEWRQGAAAFPLKLSRTAFGAAPEPEAISAEDLAASKEAARKFAGSWVGTLDTGAGKLRLRVNIAKSANGAAAATMDSLDQGANGIPLSGMTFKDGKLRFDARGLAGSFEGTVSTDRGSIAGRWKQGPADLALELKKETGTK